MEWSFFHPILILGTDYLRVPMPWTILTQQPSQTLTGGSGRDQLKGSPQVGSVWLLHSKHRTLPPAEQSSANKVADLPGYS